MKWLELIFTAIGGAGVALGAAAWLSQKWLTHRLSKELETHKTQLTQKSEVLKTELSIYAHEQSVGLSRIDAQRSLAVGIGVLVAADIELIGVGEHDR